MTVKKQFNSVATIKFDEDSEKAMDALLFLKTFKRRQGRFLTALITWFLEHRNELCYNASSGEIIDISFIYERMKSARLDETTVQFLNDNPEAFSAVACVVILLDGAVIDKSKLSFIMKVLSAGATAKVLSVLSKAVDIDVEILSTLMTAMKCGVTEDVFLELTNSNCADYRDNTLPHCDNTPRGGELEQKPQISEVKDSPCEDDSLSDNIIKNDLDNNDDYDDIDLDSSSFCHIG